ncbi:hypothetical protein HN51_055135 [Arachis hypogaea]
MVRGYCSALNKIQPGAVPKVVEAPSDVNVLPDGKALSVYQYFENEARALLGSLEYQKGNFEATLHVFEGIDIDDVAPKMKISISRRCERNMNRRHSLSDAAPPMSIHAVSLLLEAVLLKEKSL